MSNEMIETLLIKIQTLEQNEQVLTTALIQREKLYIEKLEKLYKETQIQEPIESDIEKRLIILEQDIKQLGSNIMPLSNQLMNLSRMLKNLS